MPVATRGAAVAEFFPEELQDLLLDMTLSDPDQLRSGILRLSDGIQANVAHIQEYNSERLDPKAFAERIGTAYEQGACATAMAGAATAVSGAYLRECRGSAGYNEPCREDRIHISKKPSAQSLVVQGGCVLAADVTFLMPVFRPDSAYFEAIDSIANQTAGDLRLLIGSDGNSVTDRSTLEYAQLVLPDVQIIDLPRSGLLATRNALIRACSTKWAVF